MDVVPPPKPVPTDDVKTPPVDTPSPSEAPADAKTDAVKPVAPKPPKAKRTDVGLAIAATVVIVLGLAALFVYAYLRTNGVNL